DRYFCKQGCHNLYKRMPHRQCLGICQQCAFQFRCPCQSNWNYYLYFCWEKLISFSIADFTLFTHYFCYNKLTQSTWKRTDVVGAKEMRYTRNTTMKNGVFP